MATPFTHTSLQTTLARPGQSGSGKTSSPATIGTRDPGTEPIAGPWAIQHPAMALIFAARIKA